MGVLAWIMMGLAIWHFTIFLPDRFWGGIVGRLPRRARSARSSSASSSTASRSPARTTRTSCTALEAIPGAVLGIAAMYLEGVRRGNAALEL